MANSAFKKVIYLSYDCRSDQPELLPLEDSGLSSEPLLFDLTFYNSIAPMGFLPRVNWVVFPGEGQLPQSPSTQPTVYALCFSGKVFSS